jgi:GNAT superfamily N-acetyltransferase
VIELRREPPDGPAAQALFAAYMDLVRERLGPRFEPTEDIFATVSDFEGPGAAFLVLYDDGEAVGCGALRPAGPGTAEIKRMFVAAGARGRGHGRRLLAELEAIARAAGRRRVRLYTTGVLTEARALYEAAGYSLASTRRDGGREDYWLEKDLAG